MGDRFRDWATTTTVCALMSVTAQAGAAEADTPPQGDLLEEVVVRGEPLNKTHQVNVGAFGERDLMDIPIAIQNYTAEDIEKNVARTLLDVLQDDPSVQGASVGGAYDNFRLRGFAIDWTNTLRRDGLSLAPYQDVALENIERVDALKGPSGFLYGFNSPGGSINYIVKRPTATPFMTANLHLSSFNGRYVGVDTSHSTPGGMFGVRFNGAYEKVGSFDHAGDLERYFASVAADVRLTERAVLQLNVDYQDVSKIADPLLRANQSSRADRLDPATFIEPPEVDRRDLLSPSWFRYEHRGANADAKLDVRLSDDWFAVLQVNRSENKRPMAFQDLFDIEPNGDVLFGALFYSPNNRMLVRSAQAYVGGKFATGGIGHDVFTGASVKAYDDWQTTDEYPEVNVGNVLHPVDPPRYEFGSFTLLRKNIVREKSLFFSDLVTLTPRWQALLGVRYIDYESNSHDAAGVKIQEQIEDAVVPSFGLIFKPVPNLTTYVSYSRGLEQGEYPPFFADNVGEQTAPIKSKQVEAGVKAGIGRRYDLGLAVFNIEREAGYVNLDNLFVLDGTQRHRGVEAVASARVASFKLGVSLAYLDTELMDVTELATLGKRTEGTPEWSGGVSVDYDVPAVNGLSIGSTVTLSSDRPVDPQNSGFIDGYTVVDANAQYAFKWGNRFTRVRLNVRNLFDTYYYSSVFFQGGLNVGRPREIVLSIATDL